jgi:hypothetical protein
MRSNRKKLWAVIYRDTGEVVTSGVDRPACFFTRADARRWRFNSCRDGAQYQTVRVR